ncbi:tetraacyldisaccharide 4'-kinase [Persephonella sp.]
MFRKTLSYVYGSGAFIRRSLYNTGILKVKRLPVPVISIGNLSVGGTGKTPLTIYTAKKLQEIGKKVCILSRGYKRKSKGTVVISDGQKILVNDYKISGDEPYLMALKKIPVVVSPSRYEGGIIALEHMEVDVFILDDGFQHFQLYRDVDILTVDATKPFWEDKLLPEGHLREPKSFYKYGDIIVLNKFASVRDELVRKKLLNTVKNLDKPFFISDEKIKNIISDGTRFPLEFLKGKKVGIFSGLGNNKQFFYTVENLTEIYSFEIVKKISFPDHYDYENIDLPNEVDLWLTTEKDIIKIRNRKDVFALEYELELEPKYLEFILDKLKLK